MNQTDFKSGKVVLNDFPANLDSSYKGIEDVLKEDMLQVEYPNNYVLDVGWYGDLHVGKFIAYVIHNYDWSDPIFIETAQNIEEISRLILALVDRIENQLNK